MAQQAAKASKKRASVAPVDSNTELPRNSSAMATDAAESSTPRMTGSTLIKALKAASDPPTPGGPSKIELATEAWRDSSLLVPRKADVVRDWIVEAWGRVKPGPANPILSAAYHRLLVIVTPSCATPVAAPLSLLSTYVASCKPVPGAKATDLKHDLAALPAAAEASLPILFNETKAESWAELWGQVVGAFAEIPPNSPAAAALVPAADLVCAQLAAALTTSPNAKKIAAGLHASLPAYAKALTHALPMFEGLTSQLFFPIPALQTVDPIKALLAPLSACKSESDLRPALSLLPHLFDAFVTATVKNRYTLYAKVNADRPIDVIVADRVRGAVIPALGACLDLANRVEDSVGLPDAVWGARLAMWETLVSWGGYLETEERAGALVAAETKRAAAALAAYGASEANATDEGLAGKILRTLDALERLDHSRAGTDAVVVGWCLASPARTHAAARALLTSTLRFHQLTHSLATFIDLLADAATGLFDSALPPPALAAVYTLVAAGPLSDKKFTNDLEAAVRTTNLAGWRSAQWASLLDDIGRRVRTALAESGSLSNGTVGEKRKRAGGRQVADAPARLVGVLSRLASVILRAGARAKTRDGDDETGGAIGAIARAFVPDTEDEGMEVDEDRKDKRRRKSSSKAAATRDVSADLVEAARLRVARSAQLCAPAEPVVTDTPVEVAIASSVGCPELALESFRFLGTHLALTAYGEDSSRPAAVDAALNLLSTPGTAVWSGRDATVTSVSLAAACWTVLAQAGLSFLDATADTRQIDRLATLVVSLAATPGVSAAPDLTLRAAVARILGNADTWELPAFRAALLRALAAGSDGTFAVLSACPTQWLMKSTSGRTALLDAAYAADVTSAPQRAAIRVWLARLATTGILGKLDTGKLDSMLATAAGAEDETLALARAAFPHLMRTSLPDLLDKAVVALGCKEQVGDVRARAVPLLLAALSATPIVKLSADPAQLESLEAAVRKVLVPRVDAVLKDITGPRVPEVLAAYRTLNAYARWLGKDDGSDIGTRLLTLVLRGAADKSLAVVALDFVPRDAVVAAFLLLSGQHASVELDAAFRSYARTLSADEYAAALSALVLRAGDASGTPAAVSTALRAACILVSAPVEGSGKAIAAVLQSLLAGVDAAAHVPDVRVVEDALQLIGALMDDRTGLLRSDDVAQILATLTAVLLPTPGEADTDTGDAASAATAICAPHILLLALAPLLTLARHRADLVLAHLPSVVAALAAALPLLQRARGRGRAGRKHLRARRPFWLAADPATADPVGAHAALLSRALVALCTARLPTEGDAPARTLAGPLAKHAPAILVAYARAAADAWAGIPAAARAELEPGLGALCDVVTAGGRGQDGRGREGEGVGAAFGLAERDEAERAVWADMWRVWGKRRYTGRG